MFDFVDFISVSMDGPTVCSKIKKINYNDVIKNIECIQKKNHLKNNILINCVLSTLNLDEVENLILLSKKMNLKISFEPIYMFENNINILNKTHSLLDHDFVYFIKSKNLYNNKLVDIVKKIIEFKKKKYPIINSFTYLNHIIDSRNKIKCKIQKSILSIDSNGNIYTCRIHSSILQNVFFNKITNNSLLDAWNISKLKIKTTSCSCDGCLFFGYVETNLLLGYNIESFINYNWI